MMVAYVDAHPRASAIILSPHGQDVVRDILAGARSHKDLKSAFDWENTPEGHKYWSRQRQADELSMEARVKLARAAQMRLGSNDNRQLQFKQTA